MITIKSTALLALLLSINTNANAGMVKANVIQAFGDFNGDLVIDTARGFPNANDGAGRVDIHWGQPSYIPTNPTVISAVMYPNSKLRSGLLGAALAAGDFNGDGADDLAIGAPDSSDDGHAEGGGSVHVIFGCSACNTLDANGGGLPADMSPLNPLSPNTWHQSRSSPSSRNTPRLGFALASGDFNNDGFDDLAMSLPYDTFSGKSEAGMVQVQYGSPSGLQSLATQFHHGNLGASYALEDRDNFGWDLAAANLDGLNGDELIVGTPGQDWDDLADAGEATVFWSDAQQATLSASSTTLVRMSTTWFGSTLEKQRFGTELIARSNPALGDRSWQGSIKGGIETSSACDIASIELRVDKDRDITLSPTGFTCGANFCNINNNSSDGQLPPVPIHFTQIAQPDSAGGTVMDASSLPGDWEGMHPITNNQLNGPLNYYLAMTDLINQQMVSSNGGPVCDGKDCLEFVYGGHSTLNQISSSCPELAAFADPKLQLTENCDVDCAPRPLSPTERAGSLSTYAHEAILVCIANGALPDDALNVIIYDVCSEVNGSIQCAGGGNRNGRARSGLHPFTGNRIFNKNNPYHPGMYIDWERALQPRAAGVADVSAAEEHEIGHAFGLHHRVMCSRSPITPTMYSSDIVSDTGNNEIGTMDIPEGCFEGGRIREQGFSSFPGYDFYDRNIVEVKQLIAVARKHHKELWTCPAN